MHIHQGLVKLHGTEPIYSMDVLFNTIKPEHTCDVEHRDPKLPWSSGVPLISAIIVPVGK